MNTAECIAQLNQVLSQSNAQNISSLTSRARWDHREECIENFWWMNAINNYIQTTDRETLVDTTQQEVSSGYGESYSTTSSTSYDFNPSSDLWITQIVSFLQDVGIILLLIFAWYFLYRAIKYCVIFFYDVTNASRMVYMRVLQTRGDTKVDREVEKELAKDMKEKISRMSQVYNNLYKLWSTSFRESMLSFFVKKPKIALTIAYEQWKVEFIVWVYPEFRSVVEAAISAQFSDSTIELVDRPNFVQKQYNNLSVLEPARDTAYTIKTFKYMPDDPLNNIVDSIAKVSSEDTFHVLMVLKPAGKKHNTKMKKFADALFKEQDSVVKKIPWRRYIVMPWTIVDLFVYGSKRSYIVKSKKKQVGWIVRMIKAEEDAYQSMGEEAANHAFETWITLMTSSDDKKRASDNIKTVVNAYSIFADQYLNELVISNFREDIAGWFFKPLWRFAVRFRLIHFFSTVHVFSVNALSSLFHFPDGVYNRSQAIRWMEYKALWAPSNAPVLDPAYDTWYVVSGIVAEKYMWGSIDKITRAHPTSAVGVRIEKKEKLIPIEHYHEQDLADKEIVEKDDKKYVQSFEEHQLSGYKINRQWVLLGVNVYRNRFTPIYMQREDRMRHHYVIGKSGTGKSVFLQTIARQDMWNGDWVCVIDPHGDLVEDMLEFVPKERAKDIVYFDAGNQDRPLGLNLYDIDSVDQADRTVNDATEIFLKMFGPEIFWPRIQEYFKYGSLTLLEDLEDKPTLLDVPRLFTDEGYREYKTKRVQNAVVKNFWDKTYNAMGDREKQEIIPYFTSKFVSFSTNRLIRNIIGQTHSAIKFREAMDSQKIILVSLSKWNIGEINAQLLGMILVSQIYNGAMWRADMAQKDRKDFFLYVDEFQNFVSATFADILSEARKYRLGLIMAHQYIAQLEAGKGLGDSWGGKGDVKAAVFGNVGTMMSFKVGAPDAEFLEKEYAPVLGAQDIIGIANYKAYAKLNIDNSTSRAFSLTSIYTNDYKNKKIAQILKEYSAKKYGRKREFIDAEISARLWLSDIDDGENKDPEILKEEQERVVQEKDFSTAKMPENTWLQESSDAQSDDQSV